MSSIKKAINNTQKAIVTIKNLFQHYLSNSLNLMRVTAPLFVKSEEGLNDFLDHKQKPVSFYAQNLDMDLEIVQSLAKWKRVALLNYGFNKYEGLYTDMNAIRKDDEIDNTHSLYVDQWDWELMIDEKDRSLHYLFNIVRKIYNAIWQTQIEVNKIYKSNQIILPQELVFISTTELYLKYPDVSPSERERLFAKEHLAFFVYQIGRPLQDGIVHSPRSPEYDDWDLNGDLIVYHPLIDDALELSSMGIRVTKEVFIRQTRYDDYVKYNDEHSYYKLILADCLPQSIGGGIGQSRLCMFLLNKRHIGEVQASVWPKKEREKYLKEYNVHLL
ncbi:aspartate--ammonia ligase [Ureaplasma canigenitalium]|uniref:aspartate--ammonia ligase n=1 Tax=Ureaplasma canigenitalium TaxID=42092 RepID=UPI0004E1251B|nr:amino acid--tRNA ligase-related protein [Ureaplasma canigenitalium]